MWWGLASPEAPEVNGLFAAGDKGQYIYVCPEKKLVLVRNGIRERLPPNQWVAVFSELSRRFEA